MRIRGTSLMKSFRKTLQLLGLKVKCWLKYSILSQFNLVIVLLDLLKELSCCLT